MTFPADQGPIFPRRISGWIVLLLSCFFMLFAAPLAADSDEPSKEEDKAAKARPWYKNFVPIPIIITEPAIGEGLGIGIGYFHPAKTRNVYEPRTIENANTVRDVSVSKKAPPTVTGAFGAVTNNGTWAGGFGHMNSFRNDTIRYMGAAAYANIIAKFYVFDRPFEFNLEGLLIYQDVKFRLRQSNWFLGVGLSYMDATNAFKISPPEIVGADRDLLASDFRDIGLKARAMYETRDDSLMPSTGRLIDLSVTRNDDDLGGDYNYTTSKFKLLSFHQLHQRFVLGLRAEYSTVSGKPPFYAVPWVTLRGIPAMRFQGEDVVVGEVEGRFNFNDNWAMIGFWGKGWTNTRLPEAETQEDITAWGLGGRYKLLKDQNVWVGLDYAFGPEDNVYYVQVGHAW